MNCIVCILVNEMVIYPLTLGLTVLSIRHQFLCDCYLEKLFGNLQETDIE